MNEFMKRSQEAKRYKEQYPPGTRIVLNQMSDPFAPVPSGTKGSVKYVDDMGQIHMHWDNGRSLAVIPGEDSFRKLTEQELLEEQGEVVEKETVAFGDDCRIVLPDEPIDCSELGYFDKLEQECWNLVMKYCKQFGITVANQEQGEAPVSFDIAKGVQDHIISQFQEAGVEFNFDGQQMNMGM